LIKHELFQGWPRERVIRLARLARENREYGWQTIVPGGSRSATEENTGEQSHRGNNEEQLECPLMHTLSATRSARDDTSSALQKPEKPQVLPHKPSQAGDAPKKKRKKGETGATYNKPGLIYLGDSDTQTGSETPPNPPYSSTQKFKDDETIPEEKRVPRQEGKARVLAVSPSVNAEINKKYKEAEAERYMQQDFTILQNDMLPPSLQQAPREQDQGQEQQRQQPRAKPQEQQTNQEQGDSEEGKS
jgi:hypothetical protein